MRYALVLPLVGILAALAAARADEPARKEKESAVKRIDLKDIGDPMIKGGTVAKPLTISGPKELEGFNKGCVLHKVGAEEGDAYRYKPAPCALFPLGRRLDDRWYVRQWGYEGEDWDVFCLNPQASSKPAAESLADEIALAAGIEAEEAAAAPAPKPPPKKAAKKPQAGARTC